MHRGKEAQGRFRLDKTFTETGIIGNSVYDVIGTTRLIICIEGVGATNAIKVWGRIKDQSSWWQLTITPGNGIGPTASSTTVGQVNNVDEVKFECTTYDPAPGQTPRLLVSGQFI